MPAKSKSQRRFFGLVRAVQKGEKPPASVSRDIRKLARKMDPKSVEDFAASSEKNLPLKKKLEMVSLLKEFQEPMMLQEGQTNPVAKEFTKSAVYDQYVQRFVGLPFSQREMESINNYTEVKPSKVDSNQVKYESSDQFNNNTSTIIKKLREGSQFSYTAFTKYTRNKPEESEPDSAPESPEKQNVVTPTGPQPEDVIVAKSVSFTEDSDGSKILADFLRKLDL